jgi:hypothetical protein
VHVYCFRLPPKLPLCGGVILVNINELELLRLWGLALSVSAGQRGIIKVGLLL